MTTIERTDTAVFDCDDAEHCDWRDEIADVIGAKNGEALHPDPVRRADA